MRARNDFYPKIKAGGVIWYSLLDRYEVFVYDTITKETIQITNGLYEDLLNIQTLRLIQD